MNLQKTIRRVLKEETKKDRLIDRYLTSLIKKQWGQNLIKFRGVKLPGGIELNGRELYEDAVRELDELKQRMALEHELPPYDFIG